MLLIIRLQSHSTHASQPLDKCFFGPLSSYFKNEAPACKIPRYRMASLTGFAWSKDASVGDGEFVSQRVFILSTATERLHICSLFLIPAKP